MKKKEKVMAISLDFCQEMHYFYRLKLFEVEEKNSVQLFNI